MNPGYLVKRALVTLLAGGGLVAGSPLMIAIAAAIRIESPVGAIYVQERLGKGGDVHVAQFRTCATPDPLQRTARHGSTRTTTVPRAAGSCSGPRRAAPLVNIVRAR